MRIEFIGLPGSGKTTLRRRLLDELRRDGHPQCISSEEAFLRVARQDMDRVFRLPLKILPGSTGLAVVRKLANRSLMQFEAQNRFLAHYGGALRAFLCSDTYTHMSILDRQRVIGSFLSMGSIWQCVASPMMDDETVFFEEGLVQKSFMFVDHSRPQGGEREKVGEYLENIPHSDLVIHVSASLETSWERMNGRPTGLTDRLKDAEESSIRQFLQAVGDHLGQVTGWLQEHRPGNLLVLNSELDSDDEFNALKTRIADMK